MVKSIEEYTAEISKSYDNSRNALQNQINAIEGNLEKTKGRIEENYANQQNLLNNQKNSAASAASMQAGRSGGSFGGAANIANKKYFEQVFVPAQASLNTNRNNSLDNAESQASANRLSLAQQLASMQDEISRLGVQRYYDELERERQEAARQEQLRLQKAQIAAQNYANYLAQAQAQGPTYKNWDFGNGYSVQEGADGEAIYLRGGNRINAGDFLEGTGANGARWDIWNDIWNNGVSTNGVGSDTVQAFDRQGHRVGSRFSWLYN